MSRITVVAKLVARKEAIETAKAEVLKMVQPTRQEPGCIEYRLHQDNQGPAVFLFYENWENLSCLEQHIKSAHYQSYAAAVANLLSEKVVCKMTEIA
ncbi:MAG: putative quinol monooxygenase [Desulfobulbus sp.]|nr:putative quinol monooxygenase [Desulfobulbus sp.]